MPYPKPVLKNRKYLVIFGIIASCAALMAIASDFLLLKAQKFTHIYWQFYLAIMAMPALGFGYYMLASLLKSHSTMAARVVFGIGLYISALTTTIHSLTGLYIYILMLEKGPIIIAPDTIAPVGNFIVPIYIIGVLCCLALSLIFGLMVYRRQTVLPKWFILFNPLPVLIVLYLFSFTGWPAAPYIKYAIFQITHFIIFSSATIWLIAFTADLNQQ